MHARADPCFNAASYADITDEHALRQQAECCRRLAKATYDRHTSRTLGQMAEGFERAADELTRNRR